MPKYIKALIVVSIASFLVYLPSISVAQPPPNIPSGQQPGAQGARFKEDAEREKRALERKKPKPAQIEMEKEKKPPVEAGPSFVLKGVKVTGSTMFSDKDFEPIYKPYIDQKVTFQDVQNIADSIEQLYKKKGYLTTSAYLPEQDVAGGKIEVRVLEGKMGEVKVEGNKWFSTALIKKYFHSKKNELLNIFTLGRDLLRMNQNSDLDVKSVIAAGTEPGQSDIVLKVKDKFPYHAGSGYDNEGTRISGKNRTSISFRSTNLSGHGDSLYFNTLMSTFTQGNFVSYTIPIDTYGTQLGFDAVVFNNMLGQEYKTYDISGNTQIYTPKIMNEMSLSDNFQASTEAGMDIKSIKKWTIGEKTSDDELRMPYIKLNFSYIDSLFGGGQTSLTSKFIFSTAHFLGASSHGHVSASRPDTCGFFFQTIQTLQRLQRMPFDSYVIAKAQFQNATNTLPSSEEMQLGGMYYIRGYPEGDYLADYGAILNCDWVFPFPFVPKEFKLPYSETPLRHQFEPVLFMDLGGGRLKRTAPGERETKFLMGLGGGLKVQINRNLFLTIYWAERVGDRPGQGQGASNLHIAFQGEI